MSNYPPPPFGGQFFPGQGQAQYPHPPPPPPGNNYQMAYQPPYLHQQNHPQYHPGLLNAPLTPYANNTSFNHNHFVPPPLPPHSLYSYSQHSANNGLHSYPQNQPSTATSALFPPSLATPTSARAILSPGVPGSSFPAPLTDQRIASHPPTLANNYDPAVQHWARTPAQPDATDEAISRALATADAGPVNQASRKAVADKPTAVSSTASVQKSPPSQNFTESQGSLTETQARAPMSSAQPATLHQTATIPPPQAPLQSETGSDIRRSPLAQLSSTQQAPQTHVLKTWKAKRTQAQEALQEMMKVGFTIEQIALEGFNIELLHELQAVASPATVNGTDVSQLKSQAAQVTPSLESGEVSENDGRREEGQQDSPAQMEKTKSFQTSASAGHTMSQTTTTTTKPSTALKPGEERKDYIARLLAAKNAVAKETTKQAAFTVESDSDSPGISQHKRSEPKDPVKTELLRKRLEALKAANRPSPIQTSSQFIPPIITNASDPKAQTAKTSDASHPQKLPGLETDHRSAGAESAASHGATSIYTPRSNSFYAEGDTQVFSGLPGLSPVLDAGNERESRFSPVIDRTSSNGLRAKPASSAPSKTKAHDFSHESAVWSAQVNDANPSTTPTAQLASRKRAMASDFIDSPPFSKRRVGSDGLIQLVIDVSDEEGEFLNNLSTKDGLESPSLEAGKSSQNKAPSYNLPSNDTLSGEQGVPPKNLSALEAEMKAMREKIAQRQRDKRAAKIQEASTSTGLASGASTSGIASPGQVLAGASQVLQGDETNAKQQQQRVLSASRKLLQLKLEAERRTHAMITARAESERRGAANATTTAERDQRLSRKMVLEASIPKLDKSIEATMQRMDVIRQQQEEVAKELEHGRRERQALIDELNLLLSEEPSAAPDIPADPIVSTSAKVPATMTAKHLTSAPISSAQSSADLPDIDRPDSSTVSSHADGEENLRDEAMDISASDEDEDEEEDEERNTRDVSDMDSLFDSKPRDPNLDRVLAEASTIGTGATSHDELHGEGQDEYELSIDEQFSDDDNREDVDSGPATQPQEMYPESWKSSHSSLEGESVADFEPEDAVGASAQNKDQEQSSAPNVVASTVTDEPHQGNVAKLHSRELAPSTVPEPVSEEGEISDDEMSSSDDYEPPEPAEGVGSRQDEHPATTSQVLEQMPPTGPAAESSRRSGSMSGPAAMIGEEGPAWYESSGEHHGHFQPYESPLTRFQSYRFHPQYVANVSGGFKSLTFSHNIHANTPLCRWETAGGICNDTACEYQHFRDLSLSGNAVLLQLGSMHEGNTPETAEQYKQGLRTLLATMRDQGAHDVDAVAADIVAYRARFLNDSSRVVSFARSPQP